LSSVAAPPAVSPVENIPLQAERHSARRQKLFGFPPESAFTFRTECCSESQRNRVRLQSGIAFTFDRIPQLQRLSEHSYVSAHDVALVYAGLVERDKAFAWLDKTYEEHSFNLIHLKVEPRFDPLRSDPRFADLLRRIGLPP